MVTAVVAGIGVLHVVASAIHLFVFLIREQRYLHGVLPERTFRLRNLLSCHLVLGCKWILVALTSRHVLFEDLRGTARRLLHHQWLPQVCLLVAATKHHIALLAASTLLVVLLLLVVGMHVSKLSLQKHIVLDVLIFVEYLLAATQTRVVLMLLAALLLPAEFLVHLHQALDWLHGVGARGILGQLLGAFGEAQGLTVRVLTIICPALVAEVRAEDVV